MYSSSMEPVIGRLRLQWGSMGEHPKSAAFRFYAELAAKAASTRADAHAVPKNRRRIYVKQQ